ncbi:MAG: bifunctional diaminohydroxyphosphoribosylaminopyrimidine deaminase/5-amino-6-(5-phosphoribosylamino)uracil reductase RibD [Hydrogenibacillus sp.]|nr:bifunctional diaminohydroxyphosphoribosylaminopyrimidine deaminase/5-amino-6-(5-phosphoribosylamino)uracil reductase RibD [Hydrogenibacillus sp.]
MVIRPDDPRPRSERFGVLSCVRPEAREGPDVDDEAWMRLALTLAESTRAKTHPNPRVGAVIVKDGRVVGLGAHLAPGEAHAEAHALHMAGEAARGATMYVTLEPCNHHGRTPPCTEAIIRSGIRRVVVAMEDPNPDVEGGGIERLREAGLSVDVGLLRAEAERLNAPYLTAVAARRPFVWLKLAMTLDGRIATRSGDGRWVTNEASRRRVHELRDLSDAVLVGSGTVLADDPKLTARLPGARQPIKVILDGRLRTPASARLFDGAAPVLIFTAPGADEAHKARLISRGAEVIEVPLEAQAKTEARLSVRAVLEHLFRRDIRLLLVEGGAKVAGAFWSAELIDRVTVFIAPKIAGGGLSPLDGTGVLKMAEAVSLVDVAVERFDGDLAVTGRPDWATNGERRAP